MGTFLLETRQKLTVCLPTCCRTKLKSFSHFKFWFFLAFLFLIFFSSVLFSVFYLFYSPDSNMIANQLKFDGIYKQISKISFKNKWEALTMTGRVKAISEQSFITSLIRFPLFKINYASKCVKREKYNFEFLRLFNIDTWKDDFSAKHTFVLGAHTSVGHAIVNNLKKNNISVMSVNSPFWIDFKDEKFVNIMDNVDIERVILCSDVPRYSFAEYKKAENKKVMKEEKKFVESLMNWTTSKSIETVYVSNNNESNMRKIMKENNAVIYDIPNFIDFEVFNDPKNVFVHAAAEYLNGKIEPHFDNNTVITSANADEIASYVLSSLENKKSEPFEAKESFLIENFTDIAKNPSNYPKFIEKVIMHQYKPQKKPYVSIVVVGRHDNFSKGFESRAQNFLNSIANYSAKVPLANFEVVFVDYATPDEIKPLSKVLKIEKNLKKKTRFIVVPLQTHVNLTNRLNQTLSFYEYIAKNIGVRRSLGKFILTTNPDDILPIDFFEMISREEFTDGVLYRANRWSERENTKDKYTAGDIANILQAPWEIKHCNLSARCPTNLKKTVWFSDSETLKKEAWPCGAGDFIMLSNDMWHAIHGFTEFPANANVDALFLGKMMKFVPGYARNIIRSPIVHQYHPRKNIFRPAVRNHESLMNDYACEAYCSKLEPYEDTENWGLADEVFREE